MGKREAKAQPGMSNRQRKKLRYQEMKAEEAAVAAASSAAPTGAGDADVEDVAMAEREVTADGRDAAGASEEAALLGEAGPSGLQDSVDAMMATITHEKVRHSSRYCRAAASMLVRIGSVMAMCPLPNRCAGPSTSAERSCPRLSAAVPVATQALGCSPRAVLCGERQAHAGFRIPCWKVTLAA